MCEPDSKGGQEAMKPRNETTTLARLVGLMLATALVFGVPPAAASMLSAAQGTSSQNTFLSHLEAEPATLTAEDKVSVPAPTENATGYTDARVKARAVVPKAVVSATSPTTNSTRTSSTSTNSAGTSSTSTNSAGSTAAPASTTRPTAPRPAPSQTDKLAQARSILASRIAMYPILRGTTVEFGDTRGNGQAIVYYKSARIIINPNHTVSLQRIIDHEIWHIIDWRDNGQINWGCNVPPSNAADFRG